MNDQGKPIPVWSERGVHGLLPCRSYTRAYATHPSSVKEVFHVKRLHLGHVAHSFGLKCALISEIL